MGSGQLPCHALTNFHASSIPVVIDVLLKLLHGYWLHLLTIQQWPPEGFDRASVGIGSAPPQRRSVSAKVCQAIPQQVHANVLWACAKCQAAPSTANGGARSLGSALRGQASHTLTTILHQYYCSWAASS